MKNSALIFAFALVTALAGSLAGAADTPVGTWRQFDDATGEAKSVVEIYEDGGVLRGKIVKLLKEPVDSGQCDKCEGELKGHPYLGFPLLSGLKRDGDKWTGGTIIDPKNGKQYNAKLKLSDGGQKLEVRGYLGVSLFGRTQVWERIGEPQ